VIVLREANGEIKAFSAKCTHLGCTVSYEAPMNRFHCYCHDSLFDLDGKNIGGPARAPLAPFRVDIKKDDINVAQA